MRERSEEKGDEAVQTEWEHVGGEEEQKNNGRRQWQISHLILDEVTDGPKL